MFIITIELWRRGKTCPSGKATISLRGQQKPKGFEPDASLWHITGAVPMRIHFEDVLDRPAQGGGEHDLSITADLLVELATYVYHHEYVSVYVVFPPLGSDLVFLFLPSSHRRYPCRRRSISRPGSRARGNFNSLHRIARSVASVAR